MVTEFEHTVCTATELASPIGRGVLGVGGLGETIELSELSAECCIYGYHIYDCQCIVYRVSGTRPEIGQKGWDMMSQDESGS